MVQAADVRDLNDRAGGRQLHLTRDGRVLRESEVGSERVVTGDVLREVAAQRALIPDDDVVKALVPHRADRALDERILPRRVGSDRHLLSTPPKI
jgi:hypothetical protein